MNRIQCELCGSVEIIKTEDDLFRCSACGCNYTLEQARYLINTKFTAVQPDYSIRAGRLEKYNGESINADIPQSVTIIGNEAFADCPGLKKVTIPDCCYEIGLHAFSGCSGLDNITLPHSVQSIGYGAFRNCSLLKTVELSDNLTVIESHIFEHCKSLEKISIPEGVTKIEAYAFNGCTSLQYIVIPESVTEIGNFAFCGCSSLKGIYIRESVEHLGENVFLNCESVEEITCLSKNALPYFISEFSPDVDVNGYISNGLCRFCGGHFKGIFTKKCTLCKTPKDYKIKKGKIIMLNL